MSGPSNGSKNGGIRLPEAGEDATPFVLRCYVKRAPFRSLQDLEPERRPLYDEYKLYVWRSATLRDIATLLYTRDKSLSSPLTQHSFRIVYFDSRRGQCFSRQAGQGVTRLSRAAFDASMSKVFDEEIDEDGDVDVNDDADDGQEKDAAAEAEYNKVLEQSKPRYPNTTSVEGEEEGEEKEAQRTLHDLDLQDGDILDCITSEAPALSELGGIRIRSLSQSQSSAQGQPDPPHQQQRQQQQQQQQNHRIMGAAARQGFHGGPSSSAFAPGEHPWDSSPTSGSSSAFRGGGGNAACRDDRHGRHRASSTRHSSSSGRHGDKEARWDVHSRSPSSRRSRSPSLRRPVDSRD